MPLITVAFYPDAIEAHLAVSRLVAAGIRASTADEHIVSADWFYSRAVGGVKVQVPVEDLAAARRILAERVAPVETDEPVRCPRCGSDEIETATFSSRLAWIFLVLNAIPVPWGRAFLCLSCDRRFRTKRGAPRVATPGPPTGTAA